MLIRKDQGASGLLRSGWEPELLLDVRIYINAN